MIRPLLSASILSGMTALVCCAWDGEAAGNGGDLSTLPQRPVCAHPYATTPVDVGIVGDPKLVETSGVVASLRGNDILWMHNDSGDAARLYAIGLDATTRGRFRLKRASFVDAEDIAAARCPWPSYGPCLFIADTGDNQRGRKNAAIFIVEEPASEELSPEKTLSTDRYIRVPVSFEGGPVNVEAMVVRPDGSALLLIEKVDKEGARVFEIQGPFEDGRPVEASVLFAMPLVGMAMVEGGRMITGADLHPSGTRLAIRTYTGIYELRIGKGQSWSAFGSVKAKLVALGPFTEPQGEAIAYTGSGEELVTISEDPARATPQMLHLYPCKPVAKAP